MSRLIYPSLQGPVLTTSQLPEAVHTQWMGALSEPVRKHPFALAAAALIASGFIGVITTSYPEQVLESKWHQALSEPVRVKPGLGAQQQLAFVTSPFGMLSPEAVHVQWMEPFSEPVRFKPDLKAANQTAFTISPFGMTLPEATSVDRWYADLSHSVWPKVSLSTTQQLAFVISPFAETQPSIISTDWYGWLSEPVRVKPDLKAANQTAFTTSAFGMTLPETPVVTKWYQDLSHTVWGKTFPASQQLAFTISTFALTLPEATTVDRYYQALSEPVRVKPGLGAANQTAYFSPVLEGSTLKTDVEWYSWLSEPVRFRSFLPSQQQAFTISPFGETQPETTTVDRYWQDLSHTIWPKAGLGAHQQLAFQLGDVSPIVPGPEGWWQDFSHTVWGRAYAASQQLAFTISPFAEDQPGIVATDWFTGLSEPVRYRWFAPALQQAFTISPFALTQKEATTVDRYWQDLSHTVWTKVSLGKENQLAFVISPFAEDQPGIVEANWFTALSERLYPKRGLGVEQQLAFVISPFAEDQPGIVEANWFTALSEPVRYRWHPAALQRSDTLGGVNPIVPFVSAWWQNLPHTIWPKRSLGTESQLAFVISPFAENQPTDDDADWFRALSEPVRYRWFMPSLQSFWAVSNIFVPVIDYSTGRYVLLSPRPSTIRLLVQRVNTMTQTYGTKYVSENRCFTADFTDLFADGEFILSVNSVAVTFTAGPGDPNPSAMLFGTPLVSTDALSAGQFLQGGIAGNTYLVTFKVKTNLQESVQGQILLPVR